MIRLSLLTSNGAVSVETPRVTFFVKDGENSDNRALAMDYEGYTFTFFRFKDANIPSGMTKRGLGEEFFTKLLGPGPEAALELASSLYHGDDSAFALPPKVQHNISSIWKSLEEFRSGPQEISNLS